MSDKDGAIVNMMYQALKAGYKITFEHRDIGAEKNGSHIHIGFVDELLKEMGDTDPWDYLNEKLIKGEQK